MQKIFEVSVTGKRKEAKIKSIVEDLTSGNENKISTAIKTLQVDGDVAILPHLINLLKTDLSHKNKSEIIELLNDLKDTDAIPVMMELIREEENSNVRQIMLTTLWACKLDYSEYLPDFVSLATEGDFMEALECLTIIENLEGPFTEQSILESQLYLRDYIENPEPKDPQKASIMSEIAIIIKDLNDLEDDSLQEYNV